MTLISLDNLSRYHNNLQSFIEDKLKDITAPSLEYCTDDEAIVITESGSNKRAQFGSSSSYTYGTCVIKMKFKLKYS